jgi:hypothetical protein
MLRALPARSPYFVNAWVDVAFIGGVSIAAGALFWGLQEARRPDPVPHLAWWLGWIVNWPHFSASSYRLYHSRANIAQYPLTALGIPFLMLAAVVGAFLAPETAGAALVKIYLLWSPFHFSGQTLGITLIYARRAGVTVGRLDRAALSAFIWATYLSLVTGQEVGTAPQFMLGVGFPQLGLPPWMATAATWGANIFGIILLVVFARSCMTARRLLPLVILLPAATQYVWFVAGGNLWGYQALVPFFHSLQYLLIAWAMQLKERLDESGAAPSRTFVRAESLKWGILNVLGGAMLFWVLPRIAGLFGCPLRLSIPILFATVQIHHFFVDGVIWKLRNPRVGSPLLVDLGSLLGPRAEAGRA